jgi:hypothetical protein
VDSGKFVSRRSGPGCNQSTEGVVGNQELIPSGLALSDLEHKKAIN